jgi:hypothetical protein
MGGAAGHRFLGRDAATKDIIAPDQSDELRLGSDGGAVDSASAGRGLRRTPLYLRQGVPDKAVVIGREQGPVVTEV